jgi:hypothetical protein
MSAKETQKEDGEIRGVDASDLMAGAKALNEVRVLFFWVNEQKKTILFWNI